MTMPEITPATAVGVTATAKILGVELTAQGDALLAQGISNLTPRTSSDGEKSSRNKPKQTGEPNSTEIERNPDGSIKRVTQFDENGNFKKEIRPNEKNQHGIDGPTTKEANYNIRPDGEVYRNRDIVRKATPEEIELLK